MEKQNLTIKHYLELKQKAIVLKVYIQPKASKNAILGEYGDPARVKISIKAPPVDGQANKELIKFLSKLLKLSKSRIGLLRGETSRKKDLLIEISRQQQYEIVRIINNLVK